MENKTYSELIKDARRKLDFAKEIPSESSPIITPYPSALTKPSWINTFPSPSTKIAPALNSLNLIFSSFYPLPFTGEGG